MNLFLFGIIFALAAAAALFFFDFWRRTRDKLFLFFALAFTLLAIERLVMATMSPDEYQYYLIRLAAFLLILVAIIQKNRSHKR